MPVFLYTLKKLVQICLFWLFSLVELNHFYCVRAGSVYVVIGYSLFRGLPLRKMAGFSAHECIGVEAQQYVMVILYRSKRLLKNALFFVCVLSL